MAVMIGSLEIKSRPIKLAFLVDPSKSKTIRNAIEISSSLWGGSYNPLIPVYKRTPKNWEKLRKLPKPEAIVKGYIDAFDPDIIVQNIPEIPKYIEDLGLEIIKPPEIWQPIISDKEEVTPKFGIGIFELCNLIYREHFRYKEKYPPKIIIPKLPRKNSLFWASVFGVLPRFIEQYILKGYKEVLEIEEPLVKDKKMELLQGKNLFPRRIAQYDLTILGGGGFMNKDYVFFMDGRKNLDIIDYWNLRALGKNVIPLPIQLKDDQSLKKIIIDFLKAARHPLRNNPNNIYEHANFICSRNSLMEDMQEYAKSLNIQKAPDDLSEEPFYALQHWYPRIWDEWARERDGAEAIEIYHEENDIDLKEDQGSIQIKFVRPDFIPKYNLSSEPRFANEINPRIYGTDQPIAQALPKSSGKNFVRVISGMFSYRNEWRVGRNGLVKLVQYHGSEQWDIPLAKDVFFAWLKDLGWDPKHSTPGLITQQIFKHVEGSVRTFAEEKLLKLLEYMNTGIQDERELSISIIKERFKEFDPTRNIYKYLLSKNVFQVGAKVQCPECQRKSWFTLENLKEKLVCPKCLSNYPAIGVIDSSIWSYKTAGPFSIPGFADGAYCVLLSISFFGHHMHSMRTTPVYSFEMTNKTENKLEADFGILWQESNFRGTSDGVIFGECKTFGHFEEKDFKRMRMIAKKFPGAVLAFCTLRGKLTEDEVKEIKRIAKTGRKMWTTERPINPVLILTKHELTSDFGPPFCWKELGFEEKFKHVYGLLELADATQQIYLGLPSWQDEWFKEFEKKRKKMQENLIKTKE